MPPLSPATLAADRRFDFVGAHTQRAALALTSILTGVGAALQFVIPDGTGPNAHTVGLFWGAYALLSALLCLLPRQRIRTSMALFGAASVTVLLVTGVLRGQGSQATAILFMPLVVLVTALLSRPVQALAVMAWAAIGLGVVYAGQTRLWWPVQDHPEPDAHLVGLMLACSAGLAVGLFVAMRFSQARTLSAHHEFRYRDLFDQVPSAVLLHDRGRVLDANRAALQMLGLQRRDDIIGRDLRDFHPDAHAVERFDARMDELDTQPAGVPLPPVDLRVRRTDGDAVWVRATDVAVRNAPTGLMPDAPLRRAGGALSTAVLSFLLDDTRRMQAQAESARVRALFEAVLAHSPYAFMLTERHTGILRECNAAFERLVGHSREDLLGRGILERAIWARPYDRERLVRRLSESRADLEQTIKLKRADGDWRAVQCTGALLTLDGVEYLLIIGRDVTESRQTDAERAAVLQTAPVGIATARDGRFVSANLQLESLLGRPLGSLVGTRTADLWHDPDRYEEVYARTSEELSQQGHTRFEEDFIRPDGSTVSVRMRGSLIAEPRPEDRTIVWIVEDITQDRQTALALENAARAAEEANEAKGLFLANMSHELRTPLNGILGLLELALQEERDAQQRRRHVELARESAQLLSDLLTDVLDLAKIEAGRLEIDARTFDLQALLESVRGVYQVLAEGRGLTLSFEADLGPGGAWVHGDPLRVRQILNNYLSNALKFTTQGGLGLTVRRVGGDLLRIEVRDSGVGIDPAVQGRLFQSFVQADASSTRRRGGTGLGLAICRHLAERMGGSVGVESQPGVGSCFWAELGLPVAPTQAPSQAVEFDAGEGLADLKVLVAEDNPVNMLITTALLERAGARVTGVVDGLAAVAAVDAASLLGQPYDIVLMDIQMPELDGLHAARRLRERHPPRSLPIIALTAGALQSEKEAALASGMNDFVTKPIDALQLLERVHSLTRGSRSRS